MSAVCWRCIEDEFLKGGYETTAPPRSAHFASAPMRMRSVRISWRKLSLPS